MYNFKPPRKQLVQASIKLKYRSEQDLMPVWVMLIDSKELISWQSMRVRGEGVKKRKAKRRRKLKRRKKRKNRKSKKNIKEINNIQLTNRMIENKN